MSFRANLSLLTVITSIKVRYRLGRRRGIWWQRAVAKVSRFVVWRCPHHGRAALAGCSRPRCRVTISLGPKAGGGPRRREQEEAVLVCGGPAAERHSGNGRWLRATRTTTTRLVQLAEHAGRQASNLRARWAAAAVMVAAQRPEAGFACNSESVSTHRDKHRRGCSCNSRCGQDSRLQQVSRRHAWASPACIARVSWAGVNNQRQRWLLLATREEGHPDCCCNRSAVPSESWCGGQIIADG